MSEYSGCQEGGGVSPKGPFRTKNTTTIAKILNYYGVVFLLRPPNLLRRGPFWKRKNVCNSQENRVRTSSAAVVNHPAVLKILRVVNLLRVVFLVRQGPWGGEGDGWPRFRCLGCMPWAELLVQTTGAGVGRQRQWPRGCQPSGEWARDHWLVGFPGETWLVGLDHEERSSVGGRPGALGGFPPLYGCCRCQRSIARLWSFSCASR